MPRICETTILLLALVSKASGCASFGASGDGQIFTNPTLQWMMNPPSAWTYPVIYAPTTQQYFPGQPLTQADATNQAHGDLTAAALEALASSGVPTQGVKIVSNYQPQMISDCVKVAGVAPIPTQTMQGDIFGIVEQGAVVELATATAAISIADCAAKKFIMATRQPFSVSGSVTINGVILSGLQLKQVTALMQAQLNFNSHVRFLTPITYN